MRSEMDEWAKHGLMTFPGRYASRLRTLPAEMPELCAAIRGLVIHYRSSSLPARTAAHRLDEVRLRRVTLMLRRLLALDSRPLREHRPPSRRIIGCCRDFAVLLCATLRERGLPARVRVGFADYVGTAGWTDHWLTEYWDRRHRRWTRVDVEFGELDVPPQRFILAGDAWIAWRSGALPAQTFGYDAEARGASVILANVLHDVACLSRVETTPWDFWGLALKPLVDLSQRELALLDVAAKSTIAGRSPRARDLQAPRTVVSYSIGDERSTARLC